MAAGMHTTDPDTGTVGVDKQRFLASESDSSDSDDASSSSYDSQRRRGTRPAGANGHVPPMGDDDFTPYALPDEGGSSDEDGNDDDDEADPLPTRSHDKHAGVKTSPAHIRDLVTAAMHQEVRRRCSRRRSCSRCPSVCVSLSGLGVCLCPGSV